MVRAFASHQCGLGSNPGVDAICGLSLLLVLSLAPRGFSLRFSPLHKKPTFPNFNSIIKGGRRIAMWIRYLYMVIFIYLLDTDIGS